MVLDEAKEAVNDILGFATKNIDDEEDGTAAGEKEFPLPPATAPWGSAPRRAGSEEPPLFAEGARAALLHAASLTDPEDREARDLALCSLQSLAAGMQNKQQMWQDQANTRAVILNAAMLEDVVDSQGRCFALGTLWNIAGELANRQAMWADLATRNCVVRAAQAEDAKVHELGCGILWNLSPKVANAGLIWQDKAARTAIVEAAKVQKQEHRQARAFAMAALQNLAEESANRAEMWADDVGVRLALLEVATLTKPEDKDLRGRAIGALMNLSVAPANKEKMWEDETGARAVLLAAANLGPGLDDKSWTCSLAALWSMAVEKKNRAPMMAEEQVRAAIVKAANFTANMSPNASDSGKRARERALATLQYLTTDPENKEMMWEDEEIRNAVVSAMHGPSDGKLRIYALGALWNLSSCQKNQVKIWADEGGARAAVIEVAKDSHGGLGEIELQERAMAVLWNLSAATKNKVAIWGDRNGARAALLEVIALLSQSGANGRQARQYAFGALRNLADETANRSDMWNDIATRTALIEATSGHDAGDAVSPKRALKTLCVLAYDSANAESMWKDGAARSSLIKAAQVSADKDVQLCTLRALQALSVEGANKQAMWQEPDVRGTLADTAKLLSSEDHKARISALSIVKNLTTEVVNMESIWIDAAVRAALLRAAAPPVDGSTNDPCASRSRAVALGALRNLAVANPNKEPMWADVDGARNAIVAAAAASSPNMSADAREAREHAMAALRHFSILGDSAAASEPLWKDHEVAKAALIAAAQFNTQEQSDRKARDYAVAALRHSL